MKAKDTDLKFPPEVKTSKRNVSIEGFVDPAFRPSDSDSKCSGRFVIAFAMFFFALALFAFADHSGWFAAAGGLFLVASIILGWLSGPSLFSIFRRPLEGRDNDPRKLYNHRA